jgi:3-oxoacyl-[acyl-carrier protein] reductase
MAGLLNDKTVVVFAATGAIGCGVAKAALAEGATLFASGHRAAAVDELQTELGERATCSVVDATRPESVQTHLDEVLATTGSIDGVFNGIGGRPHLLGYPEPIESMSLSQFMIPLERILGSTFVTSGEAALRMRSNPHGGSIVTLSATLSAMAAPRMANLSATCSAIEGLTRSLAGEFGAHGIRVNCVRGSAMPETRTIQETMAEQARYSDADINDAPSRPPLGRPITVGETANTAVFLLSDRSSGTTGQVLTVCAGQFV